MAWQLRRLGLAWQAAWFGSPGRQIGHGKLHRLAHWCWIGAAGGAGKWPAGDFIAILNLRATRSSLLLPSLHEGESALETQARSTDSSVFPLVG